MIGCSRGPIFSRSRSAAMMELAPRQRATASGGGGALKLPSRLQSAVRRPRLCEAFGQQAAAEGAAVAAGAPPAPMGNLHGPQLSDSLRDLRRRLQEYLAECINSGTMVTMYDAGGGPAYPTEQWTAHFFKWLCMRMLRKRGLFWRPMLCSLG